MNGTVGVAPWLSLVVLSFERFGTTTGPCLESLTAADADSESELVLVDNGSGEETRQRCAAVAGARPRIRFLPQAANLGFAGGMNAGVDAARGEWVCLVNSDTLFPAGALSALKSTLRRVAPEVGMVGPVTNAAGNGQRLPLPGLPLESAVSLGAEAMRLPTGLLTPCYRTDFFCVAIRRSAWQQLGGLDTTFGLGYYEDFDFSLRLAKAGWQQVIAEDVFVAHVGSASFAALGDRQRALMRRNRALLEGRHPGVRFEHVREGNALALRHLLEHGRQYGWHDGLRRRAAWRLAALEWDQPRSPMKRWLWRRSQRSLRVALSDAGIVALFPHLPSLRTTA